MAARDVAIGALSALALVLTVAGPVAVAVVVGFVEQVVVSEFEFFVVVREPGFVVLGEAVA